MLSLDVFTGGVGAIFADDAGDFIECGRIFLGGAAVICRAEKTVTESPHGGLYCGVCPDLYGGHFHVGDHFGQFIWRDGDGLFCAVFAGGL